MRQAKYIVKLNDEERTKLKGIVNKGTHPVRQVNRAKILIALDKMSRYQNEPKRKYMPTQAGIASQCNVSPKTVHLISKQYVEEGLEATLSRKKRENPPIRPIVTGDKEARIIALACSNPPKGYKRWTIRLLETKVVELGIMEHVSDTTIHRVLKKHS